MLTEPAPLSSLAARLRSGELSLPEAINQACNRIDALDPELQALLPEPNRRERLLREAAALERRYPHPEARPPLFGILVGVKDIFNADGFPTRAGSRLPPELFAGPESPLVTRLRNAGALVLGKSVTTEFAYFEPGPTRNPRNPAHTPGGSSSGSAAAVAAGYCPLALGSQTVGSVIRPAAFCGVAGFKVSYGRLSLDGVVPYAPSLDHAGFFVPQAADLPFALSLLLEEPAAPTPGPAALAVPVGPYLQQASPEALEQFEQQVALLERAGRTIRRVRVLEDIEAINFRHDRLAAGEMARVHADWFSRYEDLYRPRTAAQIRKGQGVSDAELADLRGGREALRERLAAKGVDCWLSPSAVGPAPAGLDSTGDPALNLPWTHAGLPVATVPVGAAKNGLPLGLQLAGAFGDDSRLARVAAELARELRAA